MGAGITGAYQGSASEAALISVYVWTTTVPAPPHMESTQKAHLLYVPTPYQSEGRRGQGERSVARDKRGSELKWDLAGQWQPLLVLTQAVNQKQPQSLFVKEPPQLTP